MLPLIRVLVILELCLCFLSFPSLPFFEKREAKKPHDAKSEIIKL